MCNKTSKQGNVTNCIMNLFEDINSKLISPRNNGYNHNYKSSGKDGQNRFSLSCKFWHLLSIQFIDMCFYLRTHVVYN